MVYLPPHFEQSDPAAVSELIRAFPLATLITTGRDGVVANHLPLQLVDSTLCGHVARNNDIWRMTDADASVLAIFRGPDAYVTPTWYATKAATHEVVPTWNYAVAHLSGTIRFIDDAKWLRGLLGRLTRQMEEERADPWRMGQAPADYLARQIDAIVGVEIRVTRVVAKWKMSQNRTIADREGVIDGLRTDGGDARAWVADAVASIEPGP